MSGFFADGSGYNYHPNRFIGYLTFALNYHFCQLHVTGYHLVNLAIHIANGLLVYALLKLTLRTPQLRTGAADEGLLRLLPFAAALLFIAHPVQTQAVTYIVQRLTSLATAFYLAAVVCYLRWRLARAAGTPFASAAVLPWWLASLAAAVLAMKTKEISFTLPLAILLFELSFFGRPKLRDALELGPTLLSIFIIPLSSVDLLHPSGLISQVKAATTASATLSRWEYLCTQFSVVLTYLRLLVLPVNQNLDYDYPVNHSLIEPRAFLALLALLALLAFALYLYRRSGAVPVSPGPTGTGPFPDDAAFMRLAGFGILWFFLTLSIESSILPIRDVIFEHRVYLPSVGFFATFTALVFAGAARFPKSAAQGRVVVGVMGVAVTSLGCATYARNHVWRDWPTIWQDVKHKSPNKSTAYNQFGVYYGRQRRIPEAIREFQTAIRLAPKEIDPLYNLALTYIWIGQYQEAKQVSEVIRRIDPSLHKTLKQLHISQLRLQDQ